MIDTVRMTGDYAIDYNIIEELQWTNIYSYEVMTPDGMTGHMYEYKKKGETIHLKYNASTKKLAVEVSIPKFLFGHNVKLVTNQDIDDFLIKLNHYLLTKFHAYPRHDSKHWKVQRMDVCWNFQVGGAVREYIQAFHQIHIAKYTTRTYGDNETVEWMNQSKRMCFYDKEKEVLAKKGNAVVLGLSHGILRFEAKISDKNLKTYSQNRWAGELLTEDVAKSFLLSHLQRLGIDRQLLITGRLAIADKLIQAYGMNDACELFGFIELLQLLGRGMINKLSPSTYWRRMNAIKALGIAPVIGDIILPPLDLTALRTDDKP
jgi:hypothetical protein